MGHKKKQPENSNDECSYLLTESKTKKMNVLYWSCTALVSL